VIASKRLDKPARKSAEKVKSKPRRRPAPLAHTPPAAASSKVAAATLPDSTTAYARDVIAGKIVTGRLVRLACERHLRDFEEGEARGLWFDAAEAEAKIDFWRLCPHVKGRRWSGETIQPEPWQAFIIGSIYGWKRADGRRRFRVVWAEMGRKNGKTTLAYPAALDGLVLDGEPGAEVYSVATKKDQARIVYQLARRAVLKVPDLAELIMPYRDSLTVDDTGSKFEALGADADTLDGLNPSVVICDEIHKWKGRDLWDVIDSATGARDQPLIIVITTAGREGNEDVYGQEHDYSVQVLEGVVEDDTRFVYIAAIDPGDDWTDEKNFIKANPNLGVSLQVEEIRDAVKKAVASPPAAAAVKRLRFGIRSQDEDAWIPLPLWDAGRREIDWSRFDGAPCGAGLDLASSCDYAAYAECYPVGEDILPAVEFGRPWGYLFRWWFWMPEGYQSEREKKLRQMARPWVDAGWVDFTAGDVIDHNAIETLIKSRAEVVEIAKLNFDPWNATQLSVNLQDAGVKVEKHGQNFATFAAPAKLFGEIITGKRVAHDGNPCARWMADNAVVLTNGIGQMMVSRKKSKNKVDGIVAAIMALNATTTSEGPMHSYYDTNSVEFV
jgi:phage terminase large subunit-like protein